LEKVLAGIICLSSVSVKFYKITSAVHTTKMTHASCWKKWATWTTTCTRLPSLLAHSEPQTQPRVWVWPSWDTLLTGRLHIYIYI